MRLFCGICERCASSRRVAHSSLADMHNTEDPEAEIYKNLWKQRRLLPPAESRYSRRRNWHYILLLFAAYEQLYIPLQLCFHIPRDSMTGKFQLPLPQFIAQIAIDACFVIEIFLQFRTTFLGRAELGAQVVSDKRAIALRYTAYPRMWKGQFLWDLFAAMPFDLLAVFMPGGLFGINSQLLRVNRLLHGWRVVSVHGGQVAKSSRPRKIGVYCLLWLFLAHFCACIWWAIGVADFNVQAALAAKKLPWNLRIASGGQSVTWDSSFLDQYFSCFYWSVTVLVKVPWVAPATVFEQGFTVFVICIGTLTFSVLIGQITLQIKAFDQARQARSERLGKMRSFCTSRGVEYAIQKDVYQWVMVDQDFSSKFNGKARLGMLPPVMRGPLLQVMFAQLLESYPFKRDGMSTPGVNAMLMKLHPMAISRGMSLIEPNTASRVLYVLQRGCLRIALPLQKVDKKGDGKTRMRSARVSTSPLRGVKGGGLGLKSTKQFARFRVLERPGSTVGISSLDEKALYPFEVDCTTTTNLFYISQSDLKTAMGSMSEADHKICKSTIYKEYKAHVDGLKFEGCEKSAVGSAVVSEHTEVERISSAAMTETRRDLEDLDIRVRDTLDILRGTRSLAKGIPELLKQLGGDVAGPPKKTKTELARSRKTKLNDGAFDDDADDDDLAERYASSVGQGALVGIVTATRTLT